MLYSLNNHELFYGKKRILKILNLSIKKGEKVALLGSSGSGKTTLLKNLYDLKKDEVSYLPQNYALIDNLSCFHNVYSSKLQEKPFIYNLINLIKPFKSELKEIDSLLNSFNLKEKILEKTSSLSGGQKQRVAIAKAIYSNKSIFLADEPISALDEELSKKSLSFIKNSFETVICSMHNVELALSEFDRLIGIKNQEIFFDKNTKDIKKEEIQGLYSAFN